MESASFRYRADWRGKVSTLCYWWTSNMYRAAVRWFCPMAMPLT